MVIYEIEDDGQDWWFDLPHVKGGVLLSNHFVESAKTSPKGRVEMVFDVVVSSAYLKDYLPLSLSEISFQRFPNSRCISNSSSYYS